MSMDFVNDIKTVTDLKNNTNKIFKQLHSTGRPIVVTVNGKPDAVLMDVAVYEKKLKAVKLGKLLKEAEKDVGLGKTRPARAFMKAMKDNESLPG